MTKRTIMEMAKESHMDVYGLGTNYAKFKDTLEAFAALVREDALAQPEPPPECATEAEKTAFVFGWNKALEQQRLGQPAYRAVKTFHEGKPVYVAQKRPPNCGTSFCSCIECVMETEQK